MLALLAEDYLLEGCGKLDFLEALTFLSDVINPFQYPDANRVRCSQWSWLNSWGTIAYGTDRDAAGCQVANSHVHAPRRGEPMRSLIPLGNSHMAYVQQDSKDTTMTLIIITDYPSEIVVSLARKSRVSRSRTVSRLSLAVVVASTDIRYQSMSSFAENTASRICKSSLECHSSSSTRYQIRKLYHTVVV